MSKFEVSSNNIAECAVASGKVISHVTEINDAVFHLNQLNTKEWSPWSGSNVCPKCGSSRLEVNNYLVLTSYPAQSQLRCTDCGHYFGSGIFSMNTNNSTSDATDKLWQHDQSILATPKVGDWPPAPQVGDSWPYEPEPPSYPDISIPKKDTPVGWICPKCGRCWAPHVDSCNCHDGSQIKITY